MQHNDFHAAAVDAEIEWPVCGVVDTVLGSDRLRLSVLSPLCHPGMFLVFQPYAKGDDMNDVEFYMVAELWESTRTVRMAEPLPPHVTMDTPFYTVPRTTPEDMSQFVYVDCVNVLLNLHEAVHDPQMATAGAPARLALMGVDTKDDTSPDAVQHAWETVRRNLLMLENVCVSLKLFGQPTAISRAHEQRFHDILWSFARFLEADYAERAVRAQVAGDAPASAAAFASAFLTPLSTPAKQHDATQIVNYFLRIATRLNLRHRGAVIYEPVLTTVDTWVPQPDNPVCESCEFPAAFAADVLEPRARCAAHRRSADVDCRLVVEDRSRPAALRIREEERASRVVPTRAWKPLLHRGAIQDVVAWMHKYVDATTQPLLWNQLFGNYSRIVSTCKDFMSRTDDPRLPMLDTDTRFYSFTNGLFNVDSLEFTEYGSGDALPDVVAVNHIDAYFDPFWTRCEIDDIHVPGYDDILLSQDYDPEMARWLDIFIGRLFHPVNKHDKWEKLLVIKGWAATGKSTLAKAVALLYGLANVGNIPANCEEQWALASVHDKKIWMCTELKRDWKFPPAVIQSMVSGEVVPVHEKHHTAIDVTWALQGLVVGNEEPATWSGDPMNALYRRIVPFPFDRSPKTQDPTIQKRFLQSLAQFLARTTRRYCLHTS
jgi:hypothetical protein